MASAEFLNCEGKMDYKMAAEWARAEYEEKRSRFIATVSPVSTEEAATEFINSIRSEFYDARHNVFAYIIKDGAVRFSDDGEPQGTGGMPVLEVLKKRGLVNTAVVVTRYFGGVLLGAPGLVRAYTHAAAAAVEKAGEASMKLCEILNVNCGYDFYARAEKYLRTCGGYVKDRKFEETVTISIALPKDKIEQFKNELTELSGGTVKALSRGDIYINERLLNINH